MSLLQRYNGLDTIATFQLAFGHSKFEGLLARVANDPSAQASYELSQRLVAPLLYMMTRGILIDEPAITTLREKFDAIKSDVELRLDHLTKPVLGCVINIGSPLQVKWLFACLGTDTDSSDAEAMEGIIKGDPELSPLARLILIWRNVDKMLKVLQPHLYDADYRMRCTYKVAGTETRRLSSSKNALWTGMNMQNIKRDEDEEETDHASIRSIFIADEGRKFLNVDLKGADSWAVALEVFKHTGDKRYLEACQKSDTHTYVAKLIWPEGPAGTPWTGDDKQDKKLAEQFFYRQYDYRFMSKKLQHGGNYLGSAWGLSKQMKITLSVCKNALERYFGPFKATRQWHTIIARMLQEQGWLENLFGGRRNFHGRLDSDATLREAVAFLGQGCTAENINRALDRLWTAVVDYIPMGGLAPLAQVHDSLLLDFPDNQDSTYVPQALALLQVPITVTSPQGETITVTIPLEAKVGWNWAAISPANPDGLYELKGGKTNDQRTRTNHPRLPKTRVVDKRLSGLHRRSVKPGLVPEMGGDYDPGSST